MPWNILVGSIYHYIKLVRDLNEQENIDNKDDQFAVGRRVICADTTKSMQDGCSANTKTSYFLLLNALYCFAYSGTKWAASWQNQ